MNDSLRLLTYNVQCKGILASAGEQLNLTPIYNPEERAAEISDRILASARDFDIIALQEVFDEGARDVFAEKLGARYPYAVLKPGEDIGLLVGGVATVLTGNPLWVAAGFLLGGGEFDDAGLMLFSRFPFLRRTIGTGQYARQVEEVGFIAYDEAAGADDWAEKGAVYVRLQGPGNRPIHVLATHTQADYDDLEENKDVRRAQLTQLWNLGYKLSGLGALQGEEVLIVGDFNIVGGGPEWTDWINNPYGSSYTDYMHDAWFHEQCPGQHALNSPVAATDLGFTTPADADRSPQRLDYVVRNKNDGMPNRLVTQYIAVGHELLSGAVYLSDHLPLFIDLNQRREHNTVDTALLLQFTLQDPNESHDGRLIDGWMDWFVISEPGSYDIALETLGDPAAYEVFTGTNLSVPMKPYTKEAPRRERGQRFVLPEAPFFIRVFKRDRKSVTSYRLRVYRPSGRSMQEAIDLAPCATLNPNASTVGRMTSAMIFGSDRPETPFSEHDCVWYRIRCEPTDSGQPQDIRLVLRRADGRPFDNSDFALALLTPDAMNVMDRVDFSPGTPTLPMRIDRPGEYYVLVQRRDLAVGHEFSIQWTTNLTVFCDVTARGGVGERMRLRCAELSQGFLGTRLGSDEIGVNIYADDVLVRQVSYDQLGRFAETTIRDLSPWIGPVRYVRDLRVELVEVDDLSDNDSGSISIGTLDEAFASGNWKSSVVARDGTRGGELKITVAGGTFYLSATLSKSLLHAAY